MQRVVFTMLKILKLCKITFMFMDIYIITKSIKYKILRKKLSFILLVTRHIYIYISIHIQVILRNFNIFSTVNTTHCIHSNRLLMMNSYSIRNM